MACETSFACNIALPFDPSTVRFDIDLSNCGSLSGQASLEYIGPSNDCKYFYDYTTSINGKQGSITLLLEPSNGSQVAVLYVTLDRKVSARSISPKKQARYALNNVFPKKKMMMKMMAGKYQEYTLIACTDDRGWRNLGNIGNATTYPNATFALSMVNV